MACSSIAAAGLALLGVTSALDLRNLPAASASEGFVHVPLGAQKVDFAHLSRRATAGTAATDLRNLQTSYAINISIAGQQTTVVLDSGSSELWVDPDCSTASRASGGDGENETVDTPTTDPAFCRAVGRYDPSKSNSAQKLDAGTTFQYADYTAVTVNYYSDDISIGGLTIQDQIFGVANASNQTALGIMGIGPSSLEGFNKSKPYSLILESLATQGLINSRAFSLDLRDYDNSTGSLIFGGVDKGKYIGTLDKIPIQTQQMTFGGQDYAVFGYWVTVTSLGLTQPGSKSSNAYTVPDGSFVATLDSGTSQILLPEGLASQICSDVNGTSSGDAGGCTVDCSVRDLPGGLDFGINGKTIQVTYQNLVSAFEYQGHTYCFLDASTSGVDTTPPTYILGSPFLRDTYAVFDWDNQNVHLAQAADCGSDIVAIGNGTNAVPTDKGNCKTDSGSIHSAVINIGFVLAAAAFGIVMAL